MAKYQYVNGSTLTPARMEAYHGSDETTGHAHSGLDEDGSVPKIDLANHVTGILPKEHYQIEANFDIEFSTDNWITWVSPSTLYFSRVGNLVTIKFLNVFVPYIGPAYNVSIRRVGDLDFPQEWVGAAGAIEMFTSCAPLEVDTETGSPKHIVTFMYTGTQKVLVIKPPSDQVFSGQLNLQSTTYLWSNPLL